LNAFPHSVQLCLVEKGNKKKKKSDKTEPSYKTIRMKYDVTQ